ncbi:MAG: phenylalanine--tRNA ligase subunit beta [Anaerovorax sp.]
MLVPIEWLNNYTRVDMGVEEFCERMIMSGSNIETVQHFGESIEKVVVGKILSIEKHPDADKLVVTQVQVGVDDTDVIQIVTGATNIFVNAFIPVALHGSKLPGGISIKKGKLRGIESNGMLCSGAELGFDDKVIPVAQKDGIWILDQAYPLGKNIVEALGLKVQVVDFEITPNRPDCLSMIGMAREAAATFEGKLKYPEDECKTEEGKAKDYIQVELKKPDLCRRYTARVVTDVKIKQSPWWMQKCLIFAGMRPINNIVDITNYVMLEYGQPIHAFDIRNVKDAKIIVDTAEEGETFVTLDGVQRALTEDMLLIRDAEKAIALAGVMGGLNSEIEEDTKTILIESANFQADSIRATSKKLGLRTEASSRFEKGIDPNLCETAADRVCRLIELLGAGVVTRGDVDEYPTKAEKNTVNVRVERVNDILGIELTTSEMKEFFERLEMKVNHFGITNSLAVTPPTVRLDLLEEIDFVEEIARMYGYDKLPVTLPKGNSEARKSRERQLKDLARNALVGMGANEIQTYSFVSPKGVEKVGIDGDAWENNFVKLINPLGEENSVMRTILTPNMMEVLGRNFSRNLQEVKAFEIGNTFVKDFFDENKATPDEMDSLVLGAYGAKESFYTLKGMIQNLLEVLGIYDVVYTQESEYGVYHPGRCARISREDLELGIMGEVHPDVSQKYGINLRCYCAELNFGNIMRKANIERLYKPLPKYPAMSRDIALTVLEDVTVAQLEGVIKEEGGALLESVNLFDVYRGQHIDEGMKSVAFSLVYRGHDRTLTEEEVTKVHGKVLAKLEKELNAKLREM